MSLHYLDDFLAMIPASSTSCQHFMPTNPCDFPLILGRTRYPLGIEKINVPSFDITNMEARLLDNKLQCIQKELSSWLGQQATKKIFCPLQACYNKQLRYRNTTNSKGPKTLPWHTPKSMHCHNILMQNFQYKHTENLYIQNKFCLHHGSKVQFYNTYIAITL